MLERFQTLVEENRDRVYTLARYLLRDPAEAEDVTQEVLIRLWKNLDSIDGDIGGWLMRVTRNRAIDLLRQRNHRWELNGRPGEGEGADGVGPLARAAAQEPGPEQQTEGRHLGRCLKRSISELHEPYRSVIVMREVEGLKYQEIGDALEMPLNTVKVNIHRARRMLRERMREVMSYAAI